MNQGKRQIQLFPNQLSNDKEEIVGLSIDYCRLVLPELIKQAKTFNHSGVLACSLSNLVYLDINDCFILELFPLLSQQVKDISLPKYFDPHGTGAHISVIYPEERTTIPDIELGKSYSFSIIGLYSIMIHKQKYYILLVNSPALLSLRKKYRLKSLLSFKGYDIALHITIGKHLNY